LPRLAPRAQVLHGFVVPDRDVIVAVDKLKVLHQPLKRNVETVRVRTSKRHADAKGHRTPTKRAGVRVHVVWQFDAPVTRLGAQPVIPGLVKTHRTLAQRRGDAEANVTVADLAMTMTLGSPVGLRLDIIHEPAAVTRGAGAPGRRTKNPLDHAFLRPITEDCILYSILILTLYRPNIATAPISPRLFVFLWDYS